MAKKKQTAKVPKNLTDLFFNTVDKFPDNEALKYLVGHHYESLTYAQLADEALKLAKGLTKLGFKSGDRAVIFSENRPDWVVCDLAFNLLGVVNVPIHSVLSPKQLAVILSEVKPRGLFFSSLQVESKLLEISEEIGKVKHLISFEKIGENGFDRLHYFKEFIDKHSLEKKEYDTMIEAGRKMPSSQVCSIIYTSGTSGHMKGVQLTHANFVFQVMALSKCVDVVDTDKFFSILPLSHVFERSVGYYVALNAGASIGYSTDVSRVSQEIKERKPTIIIAVPRLFEKIYEKVMSKVNSNIFSKILFRFAYGVKKKGKNARLIAIFDKILFSRIVGNFGGEVRFFVSGGAALPSKLGEFFDTLGLPILEGYGLTETSPVIASNRIFDYKFGTVGPVLEGVEVKICEGGEIFVKGPNVTPGYLKKSDNAASFKDGWFMTGDLGHFDRNGFLVITGRKKDLIVLTTGKKVAPATVEESLEESVYIEQSFVFGEGFKHIGAVVVPNFEALKEKFGDITPAKMVKNDKVVQFMAYEMHKQTQHLASYERIQKFILSPHAFSIENGELTPKFSLRRHVIYARYLEEIEKVYS